MNHLALVLLSAILSQGTTEDLTFVEADPKDVATVDAVVKAYYESLSGEDGDRRAFKKRYASLFARGASIVTPTLQNDRGESVPQIRGIEDWMTRYPDDREGSFYEWEVSRRTEEFGHMASVYSTYQIRTHKSDTEPRRHGITHFNLARIDGRWWIVTLQWSGTEASKPLPEKYAPRKR
jgi:hypothetical protein